MKTLEEKDYEALRAADAAVKAARAHPGGAQAKWYRKVSRNEYTIQPKKPRMDREDERSMDLWLAATLAVDNCVESGIITSDEAKLYWGLA